MRFLLEKDIQSGLPVLRDESGVLSATERDQLYEYVLRRAEDIQMKAGSRPERQVDAGVLTPDFPLASLGPKPRFRMTVNKQGADPRMPTIVLETIPEAAALAETQRSKRLGVGREPASITTASAAHPASASTSASTSAHAPASTSNATSEGPLLGAQRLIGELTRLTEAAAELTDEQRAGVQYALRTLETCAARQGDLLAPLLFVSFLACGERYFSDDPRRSGLFSLAAEGLAVVLAAAQLLKNEPARPLTTADQPSCETSDRLWRQLLACSTR